MCISSQIESDRFNTKFKTWVTVNELPGILFFWEVEKNDWSMNQFADWFESFYRACGEIFIEFSLRVELSGVNLYDFRINEEFSRLSSIKLKWQQEFLQISNQTVPRTMPLNDGQSFLRFIVLFYVNSFKIQLKLANHFCSISFTLGNLTKKFMLLYAMHACWFTS